MSDSTTTPVTMETDAKGDAEAANLRIPNAAKASNNTLHTQVSSIIYRCLWFFLLTDCNVEQIEHRIGNDDDKKDVSERQNSTQNVCCILHSHALVAAL